MTENKNNVPVSVWTDFLCGYGRFYGGWVLSIECLLAKLCGHLFQLLETSCAHAPCGISLCFQVTFVVILPTAHSK